MSEHSPSFMEVYGVTPPHFVRFNLAFMRIPLILLTWGRCHVYPVHYPYSTISFWLTNMTIVPCVIYPNRVCDETQGFNLTQGYVVEDVTVSVLYNPHVLCSHVVNVFIYR